MAEYSNSKEEYYRLARRKRMFAVVCVVLTVVAFFASLTIGFYKVSIGEAIGIISDHLHGTISDIQADSIIFNSRLPIAIFAIIAGAALSAGGAVMQTILRNPLADPYTMGISSGASLGATIAIIMGTSLWAGFSNSEFIVVMAFLFSLIPVGVILLFSIKRKTTSTKIILIGIAVMYMFSAIVSLLMVTASEDTLSEIYAWRVGTLALVSWGDIRIPLGGTVGCLTLLMVSNRRINVLMSGANCAQSLGVDPKRTTLIQMVIISVMTAVVVSFCGTIGFIGLVGPHVARIFVGSESKMLIPASAAFGSVFLLVANSIASVSGPYGLPVGVVSAIIGCPLFIFILIKMRRNAWK